jgi:heme/copper-type cytochrome/quinol oxidase subunit 2
VKTIGDGSQTTFTQSKATTNVLGKMSTEDSSADDDIIVIILACVGAIVVVVILIVVIIIFRSSSSSSSSSSKSSKSSKSENSNSINVENQPTNVVYTDDTYSAPSQADQIIPSHYASPDPR